MSKCIYLLFLLLSLFFLLQLIANWTRPLYLELAWEIWWAITRNLGALVWAICGPANSYLHSTQEATCYKERETHTYTQPLC